MLTEGKRGLLINDLQQNVTFEYKGWNINPRIMRERSGYPKKNPFITVGYYPTTRDKFRSISNVIGNYTEDGNYYEYGMCQLENVVIRSYANKLHKDREMEGRFIVSHMSNQIIWRILTAWQYGLLYSIYCSLDDANIFPVDKSFFDSKKGTMFYINEISFNIRTPIRWNIKPDDYESKPILDIEVLKLNDQIIK